MITDHHRGLCNHAAVEPPAPRLMMRIYILMMRIYIRTRIALPAQRGDSRASQSQLPERHRDPLLQYVDFPFEWQMSTDATQVPTSNNEVPTSHKQVPTSRKQVPTSRKQVPTTSA